MKRFFQFSIVRMIAGIVAVIGLMFLSQTAVRELLQIIEVEQQFKSLAVGVVTAVVTLTGYYWLYKRYEQRAITELSVNHLGRDLMTGILLGAVLQTLTISVIVFLGGFAIVSINPVSYLLPSFVMAFTSAIFEEILVRGIVFRLLEEQLGSYIALILSAALFGLLHLGNPNSSWIAAIGIALQAGLFLAVAFMLTRNLWFPIAIHFAWNFTQSGIFGANVSGHAVGKSLLTSRIEGADWFTGGQFGPEGSVQATIFCLLATIVLLFKVQKNNLIVKPAWKR